MIPQTKEEWQEAVDAAEAMLRFANAQKFSLISCREDIHIDVRKCHSIIEEARQTGITPSLNEGK